MDHNDDTPDPELESGSAFYRPRGRRKSVWQKSRYTNDADVLDALDPKAVLDSDAQDCLLHELRVLSDKYPTWLGEYRFHGSLRAVKKFPLEGLMGGPLSPPRSSTWQCMVAKRTWRPLPARLQSSRSCSARQTS